MANILIINGPNLNLLGEREPDIYGHKSLDDINQDLKAAAKPSGHHLDFFQSNAEHDLVQRVQQARLASVEFIIINPAAYAHTSIALRDAFSAVKIPFIEVHLSNVHAREEFRQHSFLSDLAVGVICGLGSQGYSHALQSAIELLDSKK